jgi:hypothetical protein
MADFACNLFSFIGIEQNQENRCSPGPGCEVRAGFFRFEEAGDLHEPTHQNHCAPDAHNYVQMREGSDRLAAGRDVVSSLGLEPRTHALKETAFQ